MVLLQQTSLVLLKELFDVMYLPLNYSRAVLSL